MPQSNIILNFGAAAEDLVDGDIVYINSSGLVAKVTSAEAVNAVGVVQGNAKTGKIPGVLVQGRIKGRILVEDTDGAGTYKNPIAAGDLLAISGKAGGTYVVGQAFSKITAAAGKMVARALAANAGTTTGDTYATLDMYINFTN